MMCCDGYIGAIISPLPSDVSTIPLRVKPASPRAMEVDMQKKMITALLILLSSAPVFSQQKTQKPADEQPIRISTELVQTDVVVTDKRGQIVRGLTKDDFELYESGKKQLVSFFEFVEAGKPRGPAR